MASTFKQYADEDTAHDQQHHTKQECRDYGRQHTLSSLLNIYFPRALLLKYNAGYQETEEYFRKTAKYCYMHSCDLNTHVRMSIYPFSASLISRHNSIH